MTTKIKSMLSAVLALDTRSLEFSTAFLNFVWGWWLLLANSAIATDTGDRVIITLAGYGGMKLWGLVFMGLFATGAVLAYRSAVMGELVFWTIRFYVLAITSVFWFSFSLLFITIGGVFSIPAFVFAAVGLTALFGSILLRWDYRR